MSKNLFSINIDPSLIESQIAELKDALLCKFGSLESIPGEILSQVKSLSTDVIFGEFMVTPRADGPDEVIQGFRFGGKFENFVSTLRA